MADEKIRNPKTLKAYSRHCQPEAAVMAPGATMLTVTPWGRAPTPKCRPCRCPPPTSSGPWAAG